MKKCLLFSMSSYFLVSFALSFTLPISSLNAEDSAKKQTKLIQLAAKRKTKKLRKAHKRKNTHPGWYKSGRSTAVQLLVSLRKQQVTVFKNGKLITTSRVSSGRPGFSTPAGIYTILQKRRTHHSNIYSRAPMPFMQRLTWSGIALHAGNVSRRYASHGCIRLPISFARQLFQYTSVGTHVIVANEHSSFTKLSHKNLITPKDESPNDKKGETAAQKHLSSLQAQQTNLEKGQTDQELVLKESRRDLDKNLRSYRDAKANFTRAERKQKSLERKQDWYEKYIKRKARLAQKYKKHRRARERAITAHEKLNTELTSLTDELPDLETTLNQTEEEKQKAETSWQTEKEKHQALKKQLRDLKVEIAETIETIRIEKLPLRILITRPEVNSYVREVQQHLWELGYEPGQIDGFFGKDTIKAIKAFQKASDQAETGLLSIDLISGLRVKRGKPALADAHLFVRQNFTEIFNAPINLVDPEKPLGTHFYAIEEGENNQANGNWQAITLKAAQSPARIPYKKLASQETLPVLTNLPSTATHALDRIIIPEKLRNWLQQRLTQGTSMIITDNGATGETGKGTDFIVQPRRFAK